MLRAQRMRTIALEAAAARPIRMATLRSFHRGDRHKTVKSGIYEDNVLGGIRFMRAGRPSETFVIVAAAHGEHCLVRLDEKSGFSAIDGIMSDAMAAKIAATQPGSDFFLHSLRVQVMTPADIRHAVCKMPVWVMRSPADQVHDFYADVPLNAPMLRQAFFASYQEVAEDEPELESNDTYRSM